MYEGQHHSGIWGVFWGGSSRMGCQSPDGIPKPLTSRRRGGLRAGGGRGKSSQGQNLLRPAVLSMVVTGLRLNGEGRMGETGCQGLAAFKITLCSQKRTLTVENSVGKSSQRENTVCSTVHHAESCNIWCISF